jgi:hypothetical protein
LCCSVTASANKKKRKGKRCERVLHG